MPFGFETLIVTLQGYFPIDVMDSIIYFGNFILGQGMLSVLTDLSLGCN
jgi:hypothetical protein